MCVAVCMTDPVCVCLCTCVCVWLRSMARCCFGTGSQENKRLGSLRPHQLPSTLGQWRENQITCDHKHLQNKWNVVIWGCCLKMTDIRGGGTAGTWAVTAPASETWRIKTVRSVRRGVRKGRKCSTILPFIHPFIYCVRQVPSKVNVTVCLEWWIHN